MYNQAPFEPSDSGSNQKRPAAAAWARLEGEREDYLTRAREVSSLTIPFLVPPDGSTGNTRLPTPYQGTGAEGVNNLASKLVLTLFPPSAPFFRLVEDPATVRDLGEQQGLDEQGMRELVADVKADISVMEQEIATEIESRSIRPAIFEVFRHLIVAGNALIRWEDSSMRVFPLDQYVIKRDGSGAILCVVTCERLSASSLPDGVTAPPDAKEVKLYTAAERTKDGEYRVWQEIEDKIFNPGTVSKDELPYIAPRMFELLGESYGRGLGEHYLGDLVSLEALSRSIVQASAAAAHLVWLVNPNGFTKVSELQKARTGAYIPGLRSDVEALRLDKGADLSISANTAERIERKLHRAFLLNSAIQRDAERVTAEEIRYLAQQIEAAHGGTYSLMNEQLQLPIARRVMNDMEKQGRLPQLPKGVVEPKVITGIEGLGRSAELDRLRTLLAVATDHLGVEEVGRRVNGTNLLKRIAAATGVDDSGLWRSEEELAAEAQAAQQAALMQSIAGPTAGAAAGPVASALVENAQNPEVA
tara:strand:- start:6608 stop:8200 length:1593 start_codon:yes stop_codon:yes gene_type:complete